MLEKLKAAWQRSWTVGLAAAKLAVGAAIVLVDKAADLLVDPNVQGGLHTLIPDAKWGLFLMAVAVVTYISAEHRGGKGAAS